MSTEREAFEAWVARDVDRWLGGPFMNRTEDGEYTSARAHCAWLAWQESRRAALATPPLPVQVDHALARKLLREFIDLCQVGDVDENTEALGWGDLILEAKSFLASSAAVQAVPATPTKPASEAAAEGEAQWVEFQKQWYASAPQAPAPEPLFISSKIVSKPGAVLEVTKHELSQRGIDMLTVQAEASPISENAQPPVLPDVPAQTDERKES